VPAAHNPNTGPAVEAIKTYAAERAINDPVKLARAARIVRTALARKKLSVNDIMPPASDGGATDAA
jgi:hypothetical protein